jgi:hypothetical protein
MYALVRKNGHVVQKKQWYALMLRVSLQTNLYMTQKDQVFVANVVIIDLMQKMMVLNVIN